MTVWRLIESPPSDIFTQMAIDRGLFEEAVQNSEMPPILRIYRVSKPAISVGRSWRRSLRDEVCVRPTGGGLVHHGKDLLYSVVARPHTFPTFGMARTSYLSFHEAIQNTFQNLGVESRLFRCDEAKPSGGARRSKFRLEDCFKTPVATDLLVSERKIAGAAQWRKREAFLHQGSIQIPKGISSDGLKGALIESFEKQFGITWTRFSLTD